LPRITARWSKLNPAPTRQIPVLIGGGGEKKTLRYTAEYAHIWHGFGAADVIRHKNQVLDSHCSAIGRDPSEIERSAGAAPHKIETADGLLDAGATFITLGFDGQTDFDLSPVTDWIAWRDERNSTTP
jgi:alkanesulfonate monooxygenase SsuD/methylene tetrahydromethanopterin reductase-like flavin-dependent oxidoreductase (luciferase family)